jgi:hypothetical protein
MRRTPALIAGVAGLAAMVGIGAVRMGAQAQAPLVTQGQTGSGGKMYRIGGGARDGAATFPKVDYEQMRPLVRGQVDFKHFHTYEEATEILRKWAREYPDLIELYSVGQSLEGREIWQMTLTNRKTGRHTDKPAMFIEGGRHAGEISGIEATLYFANHLLTSYGKDAALTKLVDTKTFYVKPLNNPDGSSVYHYTAQTLRSTVRPDDSDNDGLFDEDPAEDLDGDGFVRQMRKFVGPGKGNANIDKSDPKGRLMQNVPMGQGEYLMLGSEGFDNDGDGRVNEDGIGGLDLHRNYPENWRPVTEESSRGYTQGGAGEYPLSEPETRAVFSFLMRHPHVGIVQSLDTSVPMILRGPSTSKSEESVFPEDLVYLKKFDQKGMEITGYTWAGDVFWNYSNRGRGGAAPSPDAPGTPLFGHGPDFGYLYYGAIWYGNEIWDGGRLIEADANGDGQSTDLEKLTWLDKNLPEDKSIYQPWTKAVHPTQGEVEVGGWNPKFWSQNPPPAMLEKWARNEALFNLYLAQQMAQVKIVSATTKPAADGATELTVVVTNEGALPTALEIAKRVKIVQEDTVAIDYAATQTVSRAGAAGAGPGRGGRGGAAFGGRGGAAPDANARRRTAEGIGWLKPGETRTLVWTVRGAGPVTVTVGSTRGGVASQTIQIK